MEQEKSKELEKLGEKAHVIGKTIAGKGVVLK